MPPGGVWAKTVIRSRISVIPVVNPNTPARVAAAISPTLCPSSTAGSTPQLSTCWPRAQFTAYSRGWAWVTSSYRTDGACDSQSARSAGPWSPSSWNARSMTAVNAA
jgi:hypothetical protein